jgi:hypothetical protein
MRVEARRRQLSPVPREQDLKQLLRPSQTFVRQHQRLRLVDRISDQALLVKPIRRRPVEALPGAPLVMQRQPKKRQHRIVDLVFIDIHAAMLACAERKVLQQKSAPVVGFWMMRIKKPPAFGSGVFVIWLRGQDLNLRPSGYEPDELPGCSTPRQGVLVMFAGVRLVLAFAAVAPVWFRAGARCLLAVITDAGRLRGFGGPARHPALAGQRDEKLSIVRFVDLAATYSPAS